MEEIEQIWKEFSALPFPKGAHGYDCDLEYLDASIAGCVVSFLSEGALGEEKWEILDESIKSLRKVFIEIPADAQDYFEKLKLMGELLLEEMR